MSIRYRIRHTTTYEYESDVLHAHELLHLTPRSTPNQSVLAHEIRLSSGVWRRSNALDVFGNIVTRLECEQPHRTLDVETDTTVDVQARTAQPADQSIPWTELRDSLGYHAQTFSEQDLEPHRYRHESPHVRIKQALSEFAAPCFAGDVPVLIGAEAVMRKIHTELKYTPGATDVSTPLMEVLAQRHGVCQDFAHLMIAALRSIGLAARYVSGYVRVLTTTDGAAPHAASHAWVAVFCPPFGWIELDPTNNARVGTDHVAIAWGRDFGDVSPLRGVIVGGGAHRLSVSVKMSLLTPS
jgi:transglutaminase-like putative cysteine protease